jgi:protein-L-isoaspartate(D-aspartate) O-methyltransferase
MEKKDLIRKLRDLGYEERIIAAFEKVDRKLFVPDEYRDFAYDDSALPIGSCQTISQPQTIAFMLRLLNPESGQKILEVGSGSGYVLALLDEMVESPLIFGTERIEALYKRSKIILSDRPLIKIIHTPDRLGLETEAPFDRILTSAAADTLPEELIQQLDNGGILVCPVRNSIVKAAKKNNRVDTEVYPGFAFVPLVI